MFPVGCDLIYKKSVLCCGFLFDSQKKSTEKIDQQECCSKESNHPPIAEYTNALAKQGKSKDNANSRRDLQLMGIRPELHLIDSGDKWLIPPARYTLSTDEKTKLCKFLKEIKFPDGYASNISRCVEVKERKISGLKSHDFHVLMQRLLPVAIRKLLPFEVSKTLIELCDYFKQICSKALKIEDLEKLETQIVYTLCKLEVIFLPSFFDVMVHLCIHLANEAKIAGPVQFRCMYYVERFLYDLKQYVRNKRHLEGSIAEGYLAEECLNFCSMYLDGVETVHNKVKRNSEGDLTSDKNICILRKVGRPIGKASPRKLSEDEFRQARLYVLKNCDEIQPFIEKHKLYLRETHGRHVRGLDKLHDREFPDWFEKEVNKLLQQDESLVSGELLAPAYGPDEWTTCYKGYIVNGYRFHTKDRERELRTQNSGVFVRGEADGLNEGINYYGVLSEIIELQYLGSNRIVLFNCDWRDVNTPGRGIKVDDHGFTLVNTSRSLRTAEPFVLACQVEQVFYVKDMVDDNWVVVQRYEPRDYYNIPYVGVSEEEVHTDEPYQQALAAITQTYGQTREMEDTVILQRDNVPETVIDKDSQLKKGKGTKKEKKRKRKQNYNGEFIDDDI